jgi:hypothetical protein
MSCNQTARLRAHLLEGRELTSRERRHIASCVACGRAAAEVEALDARLRDAAGALAAEPIPSEALDMAAGENESGGPPRAWTWLGAIAAAAFVVAVLALGPLRGPVAIDPPPTADPSRTTAPTAPEEPTPTPEPSPSPTPEPAAPPQVDPHLVGPLSACSDGTAGFSVVLPEGYYANRHSYSNRPDGEQPACRTIGPVRVVGGRQNLDPAIYLDVAEEAPAFEGATIEDESERTLPSGLVVTRLTVHTPEAGALAASDEVVYLAPLSDGRVLTAWTDATRPEFVTALDEVMERLEVGEPIVVDPEAVAQAESLFADRDVCEDPERGLAVVFPDDWWTNTEIEDLPACSWFAPTSFEFVASDVVPDEVELVVELVPGEYGTFYEVVSSDSVMALDRPATRWILEVPDGRLYEYVIQLGEVSEFGPNLIARTTASPEDLDLAMAVLDELVPRISMAPAPPGAASDDPYITAPPVSSQTTEGDFRLELRVSQDRYRAGQPIVADATLSYLGDAETLRLWGSGMGVVFTTVRQLDGDIDPGLAMTTDCVAHEIGPDAPIHRPFDKSGSYGQDDPNLEFYEAYFRDPLLRLPPGRWEIRATASFTVGGDDCGAGPDGSLGTSVEIVVEP